MYKLYEYWAILLHYEFWSFPQSYLFCCKYQNFKYLKTITNKYNVDHVTISNAIMKLHVLCDNTIVIYVYTYGVK